MKSLLTTLFLLPILLFSQEISVKHVHNNTTIKIVGGRDITFGVKETVEEILIDKSYKLSSKAEPVEVVYFGPADNELCAQVKNRFANFEYESLGQTSYLKLMNIYHNK